MIPGDNLPPMRLPLASLLFSLLFLSLLRPEIRAAEPFFKKGDVIALVGGEDMVVAGELGYLELLLTRALPDLQLRFRNLAWEGDTVFEQRRDLNFPTWEEQLDKIGATVVIAQFGQMESLGGKAKLPEFTAAYEKLIERFGAKGKRRVALIGPSRFEGGTVLSKAQASARNENVSVYSLAILNLKDQLSPAPLVAEMDLSFPPSHWRQTRDGVHLTDSGLKRVANIAGSGFDARLLDFGRVLGTGLDRPDNVELRRLLALIVAKNRLWFDYWRPQNWAFLAGDRTVQPSSRDHIDPSKRWFPPEREQFLPLIEAKEKEIDALAAQLAQP
jgi:hypothetical protein